MPDEVDYFVGFETVTHIGNERLRRVRVNYYQWAPLILLAQGLCFYIPFLIWNSCANNAGVKLRRLLKKASDIASLPPGCQQREALLAEFVDQFHTLVTGESGWCADLQCGMGNSGAGSASSSLMSGSSGNSNGPAGIGPNSQPGLRGGARGGVHANHHSSATNHRGGGGGGGNANTDDDANRGEHNSGRHHSSGQAGCCLVSIPIIGSLLSCCFKPCASLGLVGPSKYLCLLYLAVKTAYVCNVGLQFFLLGQFLGRGYLKHGLELLNRLVATGEWWASPRFPLSTLCQVRADMSGGLRSYTCQCVLPINVFNEKIFSVVWFYMAFLLPLNVLSLLFWIYRTFETNRLSYIRLCLWRTRLVELNQIHRTVRRLSQSYLGWDGVFLLRLIEHNHGSIMATLIMSRLWEFYANQMKLQEDANQLALANNAQHTLSNTTTAISNQHQIMMAAAQAAQQQNQIGGPPSGGGAGGGHGGHGSSHGHSHGHSHGPALMQGGGGHGGGHTHGAHGAHGGGGHSHGPIHPAAAFVASNATGGAHGPPPLAPMVPHGPHGHHSGQINQPGGHHPLHAANTHHAAHSHGPHSHGLSAHLNAFANATNASLLAQLQHQQQHGPSGVGANQPAGSGNVSAAVAALQAAAAAANSITKQQQVTSTSGPSGNNGPVTGSQQAATSSGASNNTNSTSMHQPHNQNHHPIHLHPLMQAASTLTSSSSSAAAAAAAHSTNSPGQQQAGSQVSAIQQATSQPSQATNNTMQQSAHNNNPTASTTSNSVVSSSATAAGAASGASAGTTTTSFITQASSGGAGPNATPAVGGPPLPPPPPAHVVAAVAAANSSGATPVLASGSSAVASLAATLGRQQPVSGSTANAPLAATGKPTSGAAGSQPAPLPHSNPTLFSLKSSNSIQAASANANAGTRFSPHTIKRT